MCLVADPHYLYSIGGLGDDDFLSAVERYDPKLNNWTQMTPMSEKRGCACGVSLEKIFRELRKLRRQRQQERH